MNNRNLLLLVNDIVDLVVDNVVPKVVKIVHVVNSHEERLRKLEKAQS